MHPPVCILGTLIRILGAISLLRIHLPHQYSPMPTNAYYGSTSAHPWRRMLSRDGRTAECSQPSSRPWHPDVLPQGESVKGEKTQGGRDVRRKTLRGVKGGNTLRRKKKVRLLYDDIVMPCYLLCVALCALVHSFVSCSRFLVHAFLRFSAFVYYYILELVRS